MTRALKSLGCTVIAAAQADQYSWEVWGSGVFSHFMNRAFDPDKALADKNHDRAITASELFDYVGPRAKDCMVSLYLQYPGDATIQDAKFQTETNPVVFRY